MRRRSLQHTREQGVLSGYAWRTAARSSSDDQLPCNGDPHGVGILHLSSTVLCRVFSSHTNSTSHLTALVVRRKRSRLLRRHSVASSTEPHPPSPWALSTFRRRAHVQRRTARHALEHNVVIVRTRASESSRGRGLDSGLSRAYVCPTEPVRPALNGIAGTHFVSRGTRSTARRLPAQLSCDAAAPCEHFGRNGRCAMRVGCATATRLRRGLPSGKLNQATAQQLSPTAPLRFMQCERKVPYASCSVRKRPPPLHALQGGFFLTFLTCARQSHLLHVCRMRSNQRVALLAADPTGRQGPRRTAGSCSVGAAIFAH